MTHAFCLHRIFYIHTSNKNSLFVDMDPSIMKVVKWATKSRPTIQVGLTLKSKKIQFSSHMHLST